MTVYNHTLGTDPVWVGRYRVLAPMVYAADYAGRLQQAYAGAELDWLNPVQREHFLGLRLVEEIAEADPQPTPDAVGPHTDVVDHCIATLELLQVPGTAGAPTARTILRGNDYKYGNNVIAEAVKRRKELSGVAAADDEESFEVVTF